MPAQTRPAVNGHDKLIDEACRLGDEAVRIAIKSAGMPLDDPARWRLSSRLLAINHRLVEIRKEVQPE